MRSRLKVEDLHVKLGHKLVLKGIDFILEPGSLCGLIGRNGAGKTTLLRSLCYLLTPHHGNVLINDKPLQKFREIERARIITWLPHLNHIPFAFTCLETVLLGRFPQHQGYPNKDDYRLARLALEELEVDEFYETPLSNLSSGERQRVLLARALAGGSDIIIFDEPIASLDLVNALNFFRHLEKLADKGHTIILSIHDIALTKRFCRQFLAIKHGEQLAFGDVKSELNGKIVKDLLGIEVSEVSISSGQTSFVIQ